MITAKLNLTKLDNVVLTKGKEGKDLLVIDIERSHLFKSDKGNVYLDIIMFETPDSDFGDYAVKQSVPEDVRTYEKDNGIKREFLGNAKIFTPGEKQVKQEDPGEIFEGGQEDLPF